MKKLYLILLIVLLLCAEAFPADIGFCRKHGGGAVASCVTASESQEGATSSALSFGSSSWNLAISSSFMATDTETVCKVVARMLRNGSSSNTVTMYIYDSEGYATSLKWAASTAYTSGLNRQPLAAYNNNGSCTAENVPYGCCSGSGAGTCNFYYTQTVASCTSHSSEPSWPTTVGDTVADNDCSWTNKGPNIQPGSPVGTESSAVTQSTMDTSEGNVTFANMSVSLTSGKLYFLVAKYSGADASNYVKWAYATSAGNYIGVGSSVPATVNTYNVQSKFIIYK